MANADRVDTLRLKHAELDEALQVENKRLFPDTVAISELKKQKLRIKDQLATIAGH